MYSRIYFYLIILFVSLLAFFSCAEGDDAESNKQGSLSAMFNDQLFVASLNSLSAKKSDGPFNIGTGYGFSGRDEDNALGFFSIYVEPVDTIGMFDLDMNSQSFSTLMDPDGNTWWNPLNVPFEIEIEELNDSTIKGTFSGSLKNEQDSIIEITEGVFDLELN